MKSIKLIMTAIVIAVIIGAGVVFVYVFDPVLSLFYPRCVFNNVTGLYCPGCGAARALHQLVHGHVLAALGFNVLFVVSLPVLVYAAVADWARRFRAKRGVGAEVSVKGRGAGMSVFVGWGILAVIVLFWILRNIPVFPFKLLAPHW